jgi:hypothetical protein
MRLDKTLGYLLLFIGVASVMAATQPRMLAQFQAKPRDTQAIYAIRMTEGKDGWVSRETYKLCPTPMVKGGHGESITFMAVAPTKDCPARSTQSAK